MIYFQKSFFPFLFNFKKIVILSSHISTMNLKSVLILSKITRYEFEKLRYKCEDDELKEKLAERGSNIDGLLSHHKTHHENLDRVLRSFRDRNITTKLVIRQDYETEPLTSYDAIFTCGGDGTFLLAANRVHSPNLPVIGINTDPLNSEGYLCLPSRYTKEFASLLDRLLTGEFKWLKRNRISVLLSGRDVHPSVPVKLHDQQLAFPEFRFYEHVREYENHMRAGILTSHSASPSTSLMNSTHLNSKPSTASHSQTRFDKSQQHYQRSKFMSTPSSSCNRINPTKNSNPNFGDPTLNTGENSSSAKKVRTLSYSENKSGATSTPNHISQNPTPANASIHLTNGYHVNEDNLRDVFGSDSLSNNTDFSQHHIESHQDDTQTSIKSYTLPDLALNEIFIGESLSSRVSYYELTIDDRPSSKQRSSGLTICTGTGSSSWSFNINKITPHSVTELMKITNEMTGSHINVSNELLMRKISDTFNNQLLFPPDEQRMAYTIRDPVVNNVCELDQPRGFARRIKIKSRCWDACIVLDGGYSFSFNDGAVAELTVEPENALLTVTL